MYKVITDAGCKEFTTFKEAYNNYCDNMENKVPCRLIVKGTLFLEYIPERYI